MSLKIEEQASSLNVSVYPGEVPMMWITRDEALDMYARFWAAHHGSSAVQVARETAKSHERRGDDEGRIVWNEVADRIERKRRAEQN